MSLKWIQVDREFIEGPAPENIAKDAKLASGGEAIGMVCRMWVWSLEHASPDGIARGPGSVAAIERAAGYHVRRGALVEACIKAGICARVRRHEGIEFIGWERYGKVLNEREKERARKRAYRSSQRNGATVSHGTSGGTSGGTSSKGRGRSRARRGAAANGVPRDIPAETRLMDRDSRPETQDPETEDPPPPPEDAAPPLVVVEEERVRLGPTVDGLGWRMKSVWVVKWLVHTSAGAWEMVTKEREIRGLQPEPAPPPGFAQWFEREFPDVGAETMQRIVREYLDDSDIRAPGHPTGVLISRGVWKARAGVTARAS